MVNRMLIIPEYNPQLIDSDEEELDWKSQTGTNGIIVGGIANTGIATSSSGTSGMPGSSGSVTTTPTFISSSSSVISYRGRVCTVYDALLLFEATKLDLIPTINRRLLSTEKKKYIRPNTVFIWNETKCGMKRWTDGKVWSPSKVHYGQFLIYKQLAKDGGEELLVKQSFSLTTKSNQKLHLICYYQYNKLKETKRRKRDPDFLDHEFINVNVPSKDHRLKEIRLSDDYPENLLPKDHNRPHNQPKPPPVNGQPQPHSVRPQHQIHQPQPQKNNQNQPHIQDRHQTLYTPQESQESAINHQSQPTTNNSNSNNLTQLPLNTANPYLSSPYSIPRHIEIPAPLMHYEQVQNEAPNIPLYFQNQQESLTPSFSNNHYGSLPSLHYVEPKQENQLEELTSRRIHGSMDSNRSSESTGPNGSNHPTPTQNITPLAHVPYPYFSAPQELPLQGSQHNKPLNFVQIPSRNAPQLPQPPSHPFVHRSIYNYSDTHTLDVLDKGFSSAK
jgi:hypothetical protein